MSTELYTEDEVFVSVDELEEIAPIPEKRLKLMDKLWIACDNYYNAFKIKNPRTVVSISIANLIHEIVRSRELPVYDAISKLIDKLRLKIKSINELYSTDIDRALEEQEKLRKVLEDLVHSL